YDVAPPVSYMFCSIPAGLWADRLGRGSVFLSGYAVLGFIYLLLFFLPAVSLTMQVACLLLLGLYYAATEGLLMAMASAAAPPETRACGLAVLGTAVALGKMGSSLLFRGVWGAYGVRSAFVAVGAIFTVALLTAGLSLRVIGRRYSHG